MRGAGVALVMFCALFALFALFAVLAGTGHAQEATPVVTITAMTHAVAQVPGCALDPGGEISPGTVTFSRTGATDSALTIAYVVSGPAEAHAGTAVFAVGSATTTISVTPTIHGLGSEVRVSLGSGTGYDIGSPNAIQLEVVVLAVACPTEPPPTSPPTSTTIAVQPVTSALPHTGAHDPVGLAAFAALLVAAGSLLLFALRRSDARHD